MIHCSPQGKSRITKPLVLVSPEKGPEFTFWPICGRESHIKLEKPPLSKKNVRWHKLASLLLCIPRVESASNLQ
jgi:hypothetical protein